MIKKKLPKIIVIIGPTASGKSALAVTVARLINGEIISADSRQVYTGLDIGTGKITKKEMLGVRHHLLDVAELPNSCLGCYPKRPFSVVQYKSLADRAIQDILKRGKMPILCGGTGLYVDTVLNNASFPTVPPNTSLRRALTKLSTEQLFEKLRIIDPVRAKNIDAKNPHRLIRSIEIATALGSVPVQSITVQSYDALIIGLTLPQEELRERIHKRLIDRIRRGMVAEAKHLQENGLSWKRMDALGLEYRFLARFLQNKITKDEMLNFIDKESWQYAKRQMVWFKKNKNIKWFHPKEQNQILNEIQIF